MTLPAMTLRATNAKGAVIVCPMRSMIDGDRYITPCGAVTAALAIDALNCGLRGIDISQCTRLRSLDFSNNPCLDFRGDVPTTLTKLIARNIFSSQINGSITKCTTLLHLDIDYPYVSQLPDFSMLTGLTHLTIAGKSLTEFPKFVTELTSLTRLSVCHTAIRTVDQNIGRLTRLEYLDLSYNKLRSIPASLGDLYQRRIPIDLIINEIEIVPYNIACQIDWEVSGYEFTTSISGAALRTLKMTRETVEESDSEWMRRVRGRFWPGEPSRRIHSAAAASAQDPAVRRREISTFLERILPAEAMEGTWFAVIPGDIVRLIAERVAWG